MKKTYLKPKALTVKIVHKVMLGTSDTTKARKNVEVLSRESSFSDWSEDEE